MKWGRMLACMAGVGVLAGAARAGGGFGLRIEEADRHAREREVVRRTAVLRNDGAATLTVRLAWLTGVEAAKIERGAMPVALAPHREARVGFELKMPAARRAVRLRLAVEAWGPGGTRASAESWLRVYPERQELPWAFLKNRRIGVVDPGGALTRRLRELGGRPEVFFSTAMAANFDGDLLAVGEGALSGEAAWRQFEAALMKREAQAGYPAVVVLHQEVGQVSGSDKGRGVVRPLAAGLDLFRELEPDDLEGWREGGWVTCGPFLETLPGDRGRALALAEERRGDGEAGKTVVMMEEALPGGRLLLRCQVPLMARWEREPACELMLNVLMRYGMDATWKNKEDRACAKSKPGLSICSSTVSITSTSTSAIP